MGQEGRQHPEDWQEGVTHTAALPLTGTQQASWQELGTQLALTPIHLHAPSSHLQSPLSPLMLPLPTCTLLPHPPSCSLFLPVFSSPVLPLPVCMLLPPPLPCSLFPPVRSAHPAFPAPLQRFLLPGPLYFPFSEMFRFTRFQRTSFLLSMELSMGSACPQHLNTVATSVPLLTRSQQLPSPSFFICFNFFNVYSFLRDRA